MKPNEIEITTADGRPVKRTAIMTAVEERFDRSEENKDARIAFLEGQIAALEAHAERKRLDEQEFLEGLKERTDRLQETFVEVVSTFGEVLKDLKEAMLDEAKQSSMGLAAIESILGAIYAMEPHPTVKAILDAAGAILDNETARVEDFLEKAEETDFDDSDYEGE